MTWDVWFHYGPNAKDSKRDTWVKWTTGSLEEALDDVMEFRAGKFHDFDAVRLEAEKVV